MDRYKCTMTREIVFETRETVGGGTLAARTGNVWPSSYTALVNGLNAGVILDEGRLVKIAREERWTQSIFQPEKS